MFRALLPAAEESSAKDSPMAARFLSLFLDAILEHDFENRLNMNSRYIPWV